MPGEVITLQLGNYANYVGAHYWNLQDELLGLANGGRGGGERGGGLGEHLCLTPDLDFGVLYREGLLGGKATYTPRMLAVDLSGSLGAMLEEGGTAGARGAAAAALAASSGCVDSWSGRTAVHRQQPVPQSEFVRQLQVEAEQYKDQQQQDQMVMSAGYSTGSTAVGGGDVELDEGEGEGPSALETAAAQLDASGGVRYWTDFLKAELLPRSLYTIPGVWHGVTQFDGWGDGGGLWRREDVGDEVSDRIRRFAEECDRLQGFQILAEDGGGFGSLAADALQDLREDYPRNPQMLWCVRPHAGSTQDKQAPEYASRCASEPLSLASLCESSTCYCPLGPPPLPTPTHSALPYLMLDPHGAAARGGGGLPSSWWWYQTSALLACYVDSAGLPYRLGPPRAGPLGASVGGVDMHSLGQLLSGSHSCGIVAGAVALPCSAVPAPTPPGHTASRGEEEDEDNRRWRQRQGERGGGGEAPFTRDGVANLSPGMEFPDEKASAECIVLRGAYRSMAGEHTTSSGRGGSGAGASGRGGGLEACTTNGALAGLDAGLLQEGVRAVRHRCVCAQPIAVPLPFPQFFRPRVGSDGRLAEGGGAGARAGDVAELPILARTWASRGARQYVKLQRQRLQQAYKSATGRLLLEGWGMGRDDVDEVQERLHGLAGEDDESDEEW